MSVFNRISDLISANINDLLDQAEDPAKTVRHMVREMQDTLVNLRACTTERLAQQKHLADQISRLKKDVLQWETKAELAIQKGRDDLAKAALVQKGQVEQLITHAEADQIQLGEEITHYQNEANQLEDKLRQAKLRQKSLILRGETAQSRLKVRRQLDNHANAEAFARIEAYERRLDDMEAEVEAHQLGNTDLNHEIEQIAKDSALDEELAALKARMQSSPQILANSQS